MGVHRSAAAFVVASFAIGVLPATGSGAATLTKTATTSVTALCSNMGTPHPPPPVTETFAVVSTVPRRVAAGAALHVDISVPFEVSALADFGAAAVSAGAGATPDPAYIGSPPGSSAISGRPQFTAIGAAGSRLVWHLGTFGEYKIIDGHPVSYTCTPIKPYVLNRTRIT